MNVQYYINKLTAKLIRSIFHFQTKAVYKQPTVGKYSVESPVVILSMLQEKDLQMYLLAMKSMMRYITINKAVVVCDPDLSEQSKTVIKQHITQVEFLNAVDCSHEKIPSGGCWERLYAISHLTENYYVIQMDADILVMNTPEEVKLSITNNQSFILGTEDKFSHLTIKKMAGIANEWVKEGKQRSAAVHVQITAESVMAELTSSLGYRSYTRGCAGFAGFSKGSINPNMVLELSSLFYKKMGERWNSWGTEQFMSNLLLSQQENVQVLPTSKYNSSNHYHSGFVLAHFIGSYRFANLQYTKLAQKLVREGFE